MSRDVAEALLDRAPWVVDPRSDHYPRSAVLHALMDDVGAPAPDREPYVVRFGAHDAWTPEEIALVREHYGEHGAYWCGARLGRSERAVRSRATRLLLRRRGAP